jgi:hypothetical protein
MPIIGIDFRSAFTPRRGHLHGSPGVTITQLLLAPFVDRLAEVPALPLKLFRQGLRKMPVRRIS